MCFYFLQHSCVRSPALSEAASSTMKEEVPDDTSSLQSPARSKNSSHAEWVLCIFVTIIC